jgi:tetratricopeptide (TPR) repeat protein
MTGIAPALTELLTVLAAARPKPELLPVPAECVGRILSGTASPSDVSIAWKAAVDTDQHRSWANRLDRVHVLAAILSEFERLRAADYSRLGRAIGTIKSLSGNPLSIFGTRCELSSRLGEAAYQEGRREPGDRACRLMLEVSSELFSFTLSECRQRDDPRFARRWFGMRGVSRLMIGVQKDEPDAKRTLFVASANDLETAFDLGNRGPSAAAYLIDALMHVLEFGTDIEILKRLKKVVTALTDDEMQSRAVLTLVARFHFAQFFPEMDRRSYLEQADDALRRAKTYPPELAFDDSFINLIHGQVVVRLAIFDQSNDPARSSAYLDEGIAFLKTAFEAFPVRYGKQSSLPSALVMRGDLHAFAGRYSDARADLNYVLESGELRAGAPEIASLAQGKIHVIDVREAIDQNDLKAMQHSLPVLLAHPECSNIGAAVAAIAAKRIYAQREQTDDPALLVATIGVLQRIDVTKVAEPARLRMLLSLQAGLQFMLAVTWQSGMLANALDNYVRAIGACTDPAPAELLSLYGDCALQLAKAHITTDQHLTEATDLLEEAATTLLAAAQRAESDAGAVSEAFKLVVTYSKAGEAFIRLGGLSGDPEDFSKAIACFDRARQLGNETSALLGHQGDAYYRLFRLTGNREMLRLASSHKQLARDAGGAGRENLSLSAKLAFIEWEDSGRICDLASAMELTAMAHAASPDWPWPPLQLSEMLAKTDADASKHARAEALALKPHLDLLKTDSAESLILLGCQLGIDNAEFSKLQLGGRQPVYVLDDPHRLLSESYVFKHTDETNAERDRNSIQQFSAFLRQNNVRGLRLPTPLTTMHQGGGRVVYVMRRARGYHLGRLAIRAAKAGAEPPRKEFRSALSYLAAFHAWADSERPLPPVRPLSFVTLSVQDSAALRNVQLPESTKSLLRDLNPVPQSRKKDAHPENWLIDDRGHLSMIDFESNRPLPVIFEAVQLLDDYPVLAIDSGGWIERLEFCQDYIAARNQLITPVIAIDPEVQNVLYGAFAVVRSGIGIQRRPATTSDKTSSPLRSHATRIAHHHKLLAWLETDHPTQGIRDFAAAALAGQSRAT